LADNYQVPDNLKASLSRCLLKGVKVTDIPKFYIENWQRIPLEGTSRDWLYQEFARKSAPDPYLEKFRRVVDIALASLGLALSSPLYIPISLAIKLDSQGPVFYRQERLGKGKKAFSLLKFRTMVKDAEKDTGAVWAGEDDPRITRVGNFLRKTRLDELPQFINVLKGEMSLVGPRPEREEFVNQFLENIPYYPMRLLVKPGITGWAQVKYGYVNSLKGTKDKLEYDLYYILNQSLLLDVGILLKTIRIVLWGQRR
jgi:exopolysaccharide biosynthesis polyprenyl glycosylphosphotransferase